MIVVIGDIVASKKLGNSDRKRAQELLTRKFKEINKSSESIISPYTITLGDEFQAVYHDASTILEDCWNIIAELYPIMIRFSISAGTIVTPINTKQALAMDGPAFYNARDGINELKASGYLFGLNVEQISGEPQNNPVLNLVNHSLQLLSVEMQSWKKVRHQVLVMLLKGIPIKEIAAKLGVSLVAVYKNRDDGELDLVMNLKESITEVINNELIKEEAEE